MRGNICIGKPTGRQGILLVIGIVFLLFIIVWLGLKQPVDYQRSSIRPLRTDAVTLAVHLSLDRLDALKETLARWDGPVAAAFFLRDFAQDHANVLEFVSALQRTDFVFCVYASSDSAGYPVNILRNRALSLVTTGLVLVLDVDFVPSSDLYPYLLANLATLHAQSIDSVFVVPAFEHRKSSISIPATKTEVRSCIDPFWNADLSVYLQLSALWTERTTVPMLEDDDWRPHIAHIDYPRWRTTSTSYEVPYSVRGFPSLCVMVDWADLRCEQSLWEPYLVMPVERIPPFDERCIYYGNDKVRLLLQRNPLRSMADMFPTKKNNVTDAACVSPASPRVPLSRPTRVHRPSRTRACRLGP
jgi:hypothetical protein